MKVIVQTAMVTAVVMISSVAQAGDWVTYKAEKFGFSMLIPKGTKLKDKEWKGGWGGLYANYKGVKLFGIARLGKRHTVKEIERFGIRVTGVPARHWTVIDKGRNVKGWIWYKTVKASDGRRLAFAGYGTGKKGSYLLVLVTSVADFKKNKADYERWYKNIKLH